MWEVTQEARWKSREARQNGKETKKNECVNETINSVGNWSSIPWAGADTVKESLSSTKILDYLMRS